MPASLADGSAPRKLEDMRDLQAIVRRHTVPARPFLCPELRMRLVTPDCSLWAATETELEALGLRDPFWAFAWPGGQALARWLLDHPRRICGRRVLAVGSGGGVEVIAAARAGAEVWAADIDPLATAACAENACLNRVQDQVKAETIDLVGRTRLPVDLVLAGDVSYESALEQRLRPWLRTLAAEGKEVLIADPGRGYLDPTLLEAVAVYQAPADVDGDGSHLVATTIYRVGA